MYKIYGIQIRGLYYGPMVLILGCSSRIPVFTSTSVSTSIFTSIYDIYIYIFSLYLIFLSLVTYTKLYLIPMSMSIPKTYIYIYWSRSSVAYPCQGMAGSACSPPSATSSRTPGRANVDPASFKNVLYIYILHIDIYIYV